MRQRGRKGNEIKDVDEIKREKVKWEIDEMKLNEKETHAIDMCKKKERES